MAFSAAARRAGRPRPSGFSGPTGPTRLAIEARGRSSQPVSALPLVLWRHRGRLDHEKLRREASRRHERATLGFFPELTGSLGGDPRLTALARRLRDRRCTTTRPFFARAQGRRELALARERTPALARRWGYLMNMDLAGFAAAFEKHGRAT